MSIYSFPLYVVGTYDQYDTVVYPRKTTFAELLGKKVKEMGKDVVGAIGGTIFNIVSRSSSSKGDVTSDITSGDATKAMEFKPLDLQKMGEECLHQYLHEYKEKLCSGDFTSIPSIAEEINHIFESLYCPVIIHQRSKFPLEKRLDGNFKEVCTSLKRLVN